MEPGEALKRFKTIAVIGCSTNPEKDAHTVPLYLKHHGYKVIPINPTATEIFGERAYKSLSEIKETIDIVNVFRPSEEVAGIVDQVLQRKDVKVVWTQLGIRDDGAAEKARKQGVAVIQNVCIRVAHKMLR